MTLIPRSIRCQCHAHIAQYFRKTSPQLCYPSQRYYPSYFFGVHHQSRLFGPGIGPRSIHTKPFNGHPSSSWPHTVLLNLGHLMITGVCNAPNRSMVTHPARDPAQCCLTLNYIRCFSIHIPSCISAKGVAMDVKRCNHCPWACGIRGVRMSQHFALRRDAPCCDTCFVSAVHQLCRQQSTQT